MKAYSIDLRDRVLAALDRGMPRTEVVTTFQVSLASLKRWLAARRDTGDAAPRSPSGGFEPTITPAHDEAVQAQVAAFPDATLDAHAVRWNAAHGPAISQWTIGRAIRRLGLPRKKSRGSRVNATPGTASALWWSRRM
ncbi:transposase [Candidatus Gracilibacteria bacterium]|nr:transposase [Candidatus Gracilibacteria bacterium]